MLAQALNDCLVASKEAGSPLSLKTFIVGRNRLENEGAKSLAEFFKVIARYFVISRFDNFSHSICPGCRNFGRSPDATEFH